MTSEPPWDLLRSIRVAFERAEFGATPHPIFSPTHVRALRDTLLDPFQSVLRDRLIEAARERFDETEASLEKLNALHRSHAALFYGLIPNYPEHLQRTIDDVRFALAKGASQVSGAEDDLDVWGMNFFRLRGAAFFPIYRAFRSFQRRKSLAQYARVDDLCLEHLDFVETGVLSASDQEVRFQCPGGCEVARPIAQALRPDLCACGQEIVVAVPSLARVGVALREAREKANGVGRCRICNQIVNRSKNLVASAGYCSRLCAKEGELRFSEYFPDQGALDGDEVSFHCRCGSRLFAPKNEFGSSLSCPNCGLTVWIPSPVAVAQVVKCPVCARPGRAGASCPFCGTPL